MSQVAQSLPYLVFLFQMFLLSSIPTDVTGPEDVVVECRGLKQLDDLNAVLVDAVVAQLLAFSDACRKVCTQTHLPAIT